MRHAKHPSSTQSKPLGVIEQRDTVNRWLAGLVGPTVVLLLTYGAVLVV